jgi:hypothetical protein
MRTIVRSAVIAALVLTGCAPRNGSRPAAPEPGALEIPFKLRNNAVILPVRVGESRELRVTLDTGMGFDGVLLYEPVDDSGFRARADSVLVPGAGAGAPARGLMLDSASFRVGEVELTNQRLVCLTDGRMAGFASDGVLGHSLLGHWAVELDYDRMTLTLHDPDSIEPGPGWTLVPVEVRENRLPWLKLRASVDGREESELDCYIDLAAGEALEMLVGKDRKVGLPEGLEEDYLGRGLSGDIHGWRGRMAWVELDTFRFEDVDAAYAPADVRSKQRGADAVIGNGLLSRFNTIIDLAGQRLWLKRRTGAEGR